MTETNHRQSDYPINPLFLERWATRAFDDSVMPKDDLMTILEAAHWAPSSGNSQPWRLIYTPRDSERWDDAVSLLMDGNQVWAKHASVLVFVVSQKTRLNHSGEEVEIGTHSFDSGSAWMSAAMQAKMLGYESHGMAGIHKDRIAAHYAIPENYAVEMAFVLGKHGDVTALPQPLQERDVPSQRLPLGDVAFESSFRAD